MLSEAMRNRRSNDLKQILAERRHLIGAEVGVWRGENAYYLLQRFSNLKLLLIDPYRKSVIKDSLKKVLCCENIGDIKEEAHKRTKEYIDRCIWIETTSEIAASFVAAESLDFVFIDGSHTYENTKQDVELWTPKICKNGIIAGDDYSFHFRGVRRAVDEIAGYEVHKPKTPHRVWWFEKS